MGVRGSSNLNMVTPYEECSGQSFGVSFLHIFTTVTIISLLILLILILFRFQVLKLCYDKLDPISVDEIIFLNATRIFLKVYNCTGT